jgi:signal transduction histidine kinase
MLVALLIGVVSLLYTNQLVKRLAGQERAKVELWAKGTRYLATASDPSADLSFVFEVVRDNTTIPLVLTDGEGNIISIRNFDEERSLDTLYQTEMFSRIKGRNEPIEIELTDGDRNFIHYDNSDLYYQLKYYPYVSLTVMGLFVLVAYFAFNLSRRAEQDQVWVGMAKETAHQLGTPLSSLIAWLEYLRLKGVDEGTLTDMHKDVSRLEVITERFSKIGSIPELAPAPLVSVVQDNLDYMRSRSSKKVSINLYVHCDAELQVPMNQALFAWVLENLVRNAIDAMEGAGSINVNLTTEGDQAIIDVADTGKGIPRAMFQAVFRPGYTSKKRGWGLGLSLAKRIIEQYHRGRIYVKDSQVGVGTTFRIILNC